MKKITSTLVLICLSFVTASLGLAQEVKVLKVKPFVYNKTVMVDNETKQAAVAVGGVGTGIVGGTLAGCVFGPLGCIAGAILGANAGGAAGAAATLAVDQIPQQVRVNGYMVTFNNGQTVLTTKKYSKSQTLLAEKIVYDKLI